MVKATETTTTGTTAAETIFYKSPLEERKESRRKRMSMRKSTGLGKGESEEGEEEWKSKQTASIS